MIVQQGSINLAAVQVPGVIVQIVPPAVSPILGVATNGIGIVGTASWGPVNSPTVVGSYAEYTSLFGPLVNRAYDAGTHVAIAFQQGASNFQVVRTTDGTDTAAVCSLNYCPPSTAWQAATAYPTVGAFVASNNNTYVLTKAGTSAASGGPSGTGSGIVDGSCTWNFWCSGTASGTAQSSLVLPCLYSGSTGNSITASLGAGTRAGTWKLSVALPGMVPEIFDNIAAPNAATFWQNLANAVNNGTGPNRGPSQIVAAQAGQRASVAPQTGSTALATSPMTAFTGGTDGAAAITSALLMGTDGTGASRTGAYALRGTGVAILDVADLTDTTQWANLAALATSESWYPVVAFPAGSSISATTTAVATLGIDTPWLKILHGDWVYWSDTVSGVTRVVSPQAFVAGRLGNLAPNQSGLNKPLAAVVGTQKTAANQVYSQADLLALMQARVDVITLPSAGGQNWFAPAFGINVSSNSGTNGDNYTRMTNFLAPTLNTAMGSEIGKLQSDAQRRAAYAKLDQFMTSLWQQGLIGNADGAYPNGPQPWTITLDSTNNPDQRVALGFEQADLQVQYLSVIDNLLINMQAGQSVQIARAAVSQ
jgi:hypothetical protein